MVSGLFVPHIHEFATQPAITPEAATAKAQADMPSKCAACVPTALQPIPTPQLVIFPAAGAPPRLGYSLGLTYGAPPTIVGHREYIVDAINGAILQSASGIVDDP